MAPTRSTSVAIVGGGPAGAVAALVLARAGFDATVFDESETPRAKIGETLPPAVRPLLERLGLLAGLDAAVHRRSHGNRAHWGADEPVEEDFAFGVFGSGWHLDRARFETMLSEAAVDAGARWHWDHHAVHARWAGGRWTMEVEGPDALVTLDADFVIDATGRNALFARGAGAERLQLDRLVGVAARLDGPPGVGAARDGFTLVEALPDGWWYSAPLSDDRVVAVYMTDGDLLDAAAARTSDGWRTLLAPAVHTRARLAPWLDESGRPAAPGASVASVAPRILPAGSASLRRPAGDGWLAVGDAAAAFDPLSSHGIGSALTTGYYGACAVADHLAGEAEALDAYCALVASLFDDYLTLLHEHYLREQRWPESEFWSRRHRRVQIDAGTSELPDG